LKQFVNELIISGSGVANEYFSLASRTGQKLSNSDNRHIYGIPLITWAVFAANFTVCLHATYLLVVIDHSPMRPHIPPFYACSFGGKFSCVYPSFIAHNFLCFIPPPPSSFISISPVLFIRNWIHTSVYPKVSGL